LNCNDSLLLPTSILAGLCLLVPCPALAGSQPAATAKSEAPGVPAGPAGPFALEGPLKARFEALTKVNVKLENTVSISSESISDAFLSLSLDSGLAAPVHADNGATIGFWFQGSCTVSYAPPLGQETAAFERGTGRRNLSEAECAEALVLSDAPEVLAIVASGATDGVTTKLVVSPWLRYRLKREEIPKHKGQYFAEFAVAALSRSMTTAEPDNEQINLLHLDILGSDFGRPPAAPSAKALDWLAYRRDPQGRVAPHESFTLSAGHFADSGSRYGTGLTSHPGQGEPETAFRPANLDLVDAELDLDISVGFDPWAEMKATATVVLTTRRQAVESVALRLLREHRFDRLGIHKALGFTVSDVTDFKGRQLDFLHFAGVLLVRLRSPLPPGQAELLNVHYAGNAMPRLTADSFGLLANYPWWPQSGNHDRFTWGLKICTPSSFKVAGTGTTLRTWKEGQKRCERWEEPVPITFPAINMGRWVSAEKEGPRGIRIRAFFLVEDELKMQPALNSVAEMLRFFEQLYGPYPYAELDIAEARNNMNFWQAPAGLLELSRNQWGFRSAAKNQRKDFYPHPSLATLAHEVAHQWWGHVVGWKTYRDQWISETFAEYASFLFMSQYEGEKSYRGRLEWWEMGARKVKQRAPMVLGFRDRRGYQGQVYRRGPYVLHMLRRMVGDEPFTEFMRQVVTIAANRNLSTADLETIAAKVLGPDVHWFFDQWISSNGLPDLEVAWQWRGNTVNLTLKQTQRNAPYRLLVPIRISSAKGKQLTHTVAIDSREVTVKLRAPPGGAGGVEIDPDRELLTGAKKSARK